MRNIATPPIDWLAVAPVIAVAGAAVLIVLLRALVRRAPWVYEASLVMAFAGIAVSGVFLAEQWSKIRDHGAYEAIRGTVAIDGFAVFLGAVVLVATALTLLLSGDYLPRLGLDARPEYVALLLFSAAGMLLMTTANDLIVVFLALEALSIPLYVLAAFDRRRSRSLEAGMKYFVLGAFSSAIFLYGIALVYGGTGTTSFTGIADFLAANTLFDQGTLLAGLMLLLVGLGFKIAAVPFHWWTPDVYEGAPSPVTGFMGSATKAAGFAALLRVLFTAFGTYRVDWRPAVWALAVLSLVIGTVVALVQTDIKRMLAYSSINHAGYVLIGLEAANREGLKAALVYLMVYAFMFVGSFAVVTVVGQRDDRHSIEEYRGLATRRPALAALLALFLFAQAGVPPTAGFIAKLGVFGAAAKAHSYVLLVIGVLTSVVSAYYYLRVVVGMYASEGTAPELEGERPKRAGVRVDVATGAVLAVTAFVVLAVGILPSLLLDFARDATLLF